MEITGDGWWCMYDSNFEHKLQMFDLKPVNIFLERQYNTVIPNMDSRARLLVFEFSLQHLLALRALLFLFVK